MSFAPGQGPEITIVATTDEDEGLSIGTIFDLFFFIGGFIYFIGGMLVRKYFRGAEGKEMIPHYEFWSDLPLLIRDGILFTVNGCKADTTYERI